MLDFIVFLVTAFIYIGAVFSFILSAVFFVWMVGILITDDSRDTIWYKEAITLMRLPGVLFISGVILYFLHYLIT